MAAEGKEDLEIAVELEVNRGFGDLGRQSHWPMLASPSASGVPQILAPLGYRVPREVEAPFGLGQLQHAQASQNGVVAAAASSICPALHSEEFQLAQPSGTVVWRVNPEGCTTRRLCQRRRVAEGD